MLPDGVCLKYSCSEVGPATHQQILRAQLQTLGISSTGRKVAEGTLLKVNAIALVYKHVLLLAMTTEQQQRSATVIPTAGKEACND
jgi:hypothetical protein